MKTLQAALAAVILSAVQPAVAEITHIRGVPDPPIQTVEQARADTEKRLTAIQAEEAKQAAEAAAQLATRDALPATTPQEAFFTGKPLIEETGQYAFLFRHYDPELNRWTTSDPSGFPDGANNLAYMAVPTSQFDWQGLKSVAFLYGWSDPSNGTQWPPTDGSGDGWRDSDHHNYVSSLVSTMNQRMTDEDNQSGSTTYFINDGDYLSFGALTNWGQLATWETSYDRVYVIAHGATEGSNNISLAGKAWSQGTGVAQQQFGGAIQEMAHKV